VEAEVPPTYEGMLTYDAGVPLAVQHIIPGFEIQKH